MLAASEMNHFDVSQEMEPEVSLDVSVMGKRMAKELGYHTAWPPVAPLCLLPCVYSPHWQRTFCLWLEYVDEDALEDK